MHFYVFTLLERSSALSVICTVTSNLQSIFYRHTYFIGVFIRIFVCFKLDCSVPEAVVRDSVTNVVVYDVIPY